MGSILIQTKEAVDALKAVGLKRHEFRARCERLMNGRTFCGYGDVKIVLLCSMEKQYALAPVLAQHFKVIEYTIDGKPRGGLLVLEAKGKPGLTIKAVS